MRWMTIALPLVTLLGISQPGLAEEWPKWLGPKGTGISAETGLVEEWPTDGPKKLWSAKVGVGYSSPVAVDGKIYFFGQEESKDTLHAFDAGTGQVVWTQSYDRGEDVSYPGTRATPTIDGDRIYTHGSLGDLVCWNLADGKQVWRTNVLKSTNAKPLEWGSASSPLVTANHIYLQGGQGGDAIAVAVNKQDGSLAWKSEAKGLSGYATLTLIDVGPRKQLIVFAGDMLYGMDPDTGKSIWSEPWKTANDVNAATPIFDGSRLLVSSTRNIGALMMEVTSQGVQKLWEKRDIAMKFQPAILDGEALYANSGGVLKAVSWPEFKPLWTGAGRDFNVGAGGSIVRSGNKLIAMSERGKLSLILATPKEYKLISSVQLFDYAQVWSTPLIYRGKLYAKGKDELVCMDISAPTPAPTPPSTP